MLLSNEYVNYSSKQKQPSTEPSLRARLIPGMQAEAANPKEVPSISISLTQLGGHGTSAGISGPKIQASAQQEAPQGEHRQSAASKQVGLKTISNLEMQRNTVLNPGSFSGSTEFNALGVKPELILSSLTREAHPADGPLRSGL